MQKINIDKRTIVFFILAVILFAELFVVFPWGIKTISDLMKKTTKKTQIIMVILPQQEEHKDNKI